METQQTPEWLIDGAYSKWKYSSIISKNFPLIALFISITFCFAFVFIGLYFFPDAEGNIAIIGFVLTFIVLFSTISLADKKFKKKYGNSPEWQKKYLQSKIDETVEYFEQVPQLNVAIHQQFIDAKNELQKNADAMREKLTEYKKLLTAYS